MYGLTECSDNYSKPSGRLGKYYRYKPGESRDAPIIDSKSIKSKVGVTGKVSNNANTKDPILTFSGTSVITNSTNAEIFAITDAKLYVLVVTLLTNHNAKALQELKSDFKRTINWNKYKSKVTIQSQNRLLDYLIDPFCLII